MVDMQHDALRRFVDITSRCLSVKGLCGLEWFRITADDGIFLNILKLGLV